MQESTNIVYTSNNPKLDYKKIIFRIINGNFDYFLGRFLFVRNLYSRYRKLQQLFRQKPVSSIQPSQLKDYQKFNIDSIVNNIHENSYFDQLEMKQESVTPIIEFAKNSKLTSPSYSFDFTYQEYHEQLKNKERIAIARVKNPLEIEQTLQLRHDSFLLEIAEKYLGYYPDNCDVMLWWSFASNLSSEDRRSQFQTIDYHYDVHGLNFFYISFYLTDVNVNSGAHRLVKSSHKNKKLWMLLRSARFPDEIIHHYYSKEQIITIEGNVGKCFLEDASCFHKALPPIEKERLFLQLRFF
ncbi:MAG: hypothetical protein VKJ02_09340 [Snowella sp.]|nr:hypothetical protein [Snowella sp.]